MNTEIFPSSEGTSKSIFKKPDVLLGILVLLGGFGWVTLKLLPILTAIIWNTVSFGIACVVGGLLLYILTNKKTWLILHYIHEMTLKKIFGLIIELDPFVIAEDYINDMRKEREKLNQQNVEVDKQKESLEAKIKEKQKEKAKQVSRMESAKRSNMLPEVGVASRQVARIDTYIEQLAPIKSSLEKISDYLGKVYKNSEYLIEDSVNELSLKKDLYNSVTSGNRALSSALKIFKGDPDKKILVEQSMEFLKDDIAGKLANMKNAMSLSNDFMKNIDLDNATFEQKGLEMLEKFNPDDLKLTRPEKEKVLISNYTPGKVNKSEYKNLLD